MAGTLFNYYLGIDLGQARDFTALSLIEEPVWIDPTWARELFMDSKEAGWRSPADLRPEQAKKALYLSNKRGRPPFPVLSVRHLERFELGTRYPKVIERVQELIASPPLEGKSLVGVVDATGVGRAVVDSFFQAGLRPLPVHDPRGRQGEQRPPRLSGTKEGPGIGRAGPPPEPTLEDPQRLRQWRDSQEGTRQLQTADRPEDGPR